MRICFFLVNQTCNRPFDIPTQQVFDWLCKKRHAVVSGHNVREEREEKRWQQRKKTLHNMPLLFTTLPTLFFTPFSHNMKVLVCRQDTLAHALLVSDPRREAR
jgi:hypothetical protein